MTTTSLIPARAPRRIETYRRLLIVLAVASGLAVVSVFAALNGAHPHAPNLRLLAAQSPSILIHMTGAAAAFGLGLVQLLAPKGTLSHRIMGWIWVVLMLTAAGSSLFIHTLNHGGFSIIHVLSAWVLLATPLGVLAVRRGKFGAHANYMLGLFYFALVTAGIYTFLPGRLMWRLFLG